MTPEGCGAAHGPRHPAYLLLRGRNVLVCSFGFCLSRESWVRLGCLLGSKKSLFAVFRPLSQWSQMMFGFVLSLSFLGFLPRGVRLASSQRLVYLRMTRLTGEDKEFLYELLSLLFLSAFDD